MSTPSLITVEANELEEILVVDLGDRNDDTTELRSWVILPILDPTYLRT